jgi:hypothetical protein
MVGEYLDTSGAVEIGAETLLHRIVVVSAKVDVILLCKTRECQGR